MSLSALTVSCPSTALATTSSFQERRWARRILSTSLRTAIRHGRSSSLRGGRCFFYQTTLFCLFSQMIQKSGYGDSLEDGPESSWLGFSLLPEGWFSHSIPTSHFKPGTEIKFPLLFTEELDFDLYPYLLVGDDGLGTVTTSWKNDPMWFFFFKIWGWVFVSGVWFCMNVTIYDTVIKVTKYKLCCESDDMIRRYKSHNIPRASASSSL